MPRRDWMIREADLDDDQLQVFQATNDRSCIVSGCAGSGKSVLALIKAQRIQKEKGNNYIVIVYTKALYEYMRSGKEELGLRGGFYYLWEWEKRYDKPTADYIIVDEIQDFTAEEISAFIQAANKNFFFFGDTAQSIYDGMNGKRTMPVEDIPYLVPKGHNKRVWSLYRNYRLPLPVARVACKVGVDLDAFVERVYQNHEKEKPRLLSYASQQDQLQAIHEIIGRRGFTDVAILLPHNNCVRSVYEQLRAMGGNYEVKYSDRQDWRNSVETLRFDTTNPKVMTYHSAKGLQFEAVFLPYMEEFQDYGNNRKALYVAITRTYKYLYIMYTGTLPRPLSEVNSSLYVTSDVTVIEDI